MVVSGESLGCEQLGKVGIGSLKGRGPSAAPRCYPGDELRVGNKARRGSNRPSSAAASMTAIHTPREIDAVGQVAGTKASAS